VRRLMLVAGLVGSFVLVAFTGWGEASVGGGHAAQATIPIKILKAKDGEPRWRRWSSTVARSRS
jgi:hypothetical protein